MLSSATTQRSKVDASLLMHLNSSRPFSGTHQDRSTLHTRGAAAGGHRLLSVTISQELLTPSPPPSYPEQRFAKRESPVRQFFNPQTGDQCQNCEGLQEFSSGVFRNPPRSWRADEEHRISTERLGLENNKALLVDGWYTSSPVKGMLEKNKDQNERSKACGLHATEEQTCSNSRGLVLEEELLYAYNTEGMIDLPSIEIFISILQRCRKEKILAPAKRVHSDICNNGLETAVGNYIVPMLVECGSMLDAQTVFDRLHHRNEHSWTSLMLGYIQCGQAQHALSLYQRMQEDSVNPSSYTLMALLKACATLKDMEKGRGVHAEITQKGLERDLFVGSSLVDMYIKCGSISKARKAFDKLPIRDVVSWTALIAGYAEHGPGHEALKCFEEMQVEGISPNVVTFVFVLIACGSMRAIGKGHEIHAVIGQKGFGGDISVGNTLVNMYAKCGSLSEAREVFDMLPVKDVVSWTVLIGGYAEHGPGHEVLRCYEQMQLQGLSPNAATFGCVLKVCGSVRAIAKGREIHMEIPKLGLENDVFVGNSLIDMYIKCHSLSEAREAFDKLLDRDVVSWNTLIAGYAEHGPVQEALACLECMQCEGFFPDAITFACSLKACGSIGATEKGQKIHVKIAQKGLERDLFVGSALVDMYAKSGSLSKAREVFDKLAVKNVVSWSALIAGYAEHGPAQEALKCFEQMQLEGVSPNAVTFVCVLKACGSMGAIGKGRKIIVEIAERGIGDDLNVNNALVDMYVKCGSLSEAQEVFDKLPVRDVVSWTALIAGYAEHGPIQEALKCFEQMQMEGICPNDLTFVSVLKVCGSMGAISKGRKAHAEIVQKGFERDLFVGSTLVDMYAKCGSLSEAREVFLNLPAQNVVSWSAIVKGHGMNHEGNMAIQFFEDMQEQGAKPDAMAFTSLLTACSHTNLALQGQAYFMRMREDHGVASTLEHYTCIVDLFARSGHLEEAEEFLETMWSPSSEGTWTALLSACKTYGEAELGQRCFQLLLNKASGSATPYVLMASVYANAGRWDDAYRIQELKKG